MTANWRNRTLFHGDNLGFLRAMNSETVDLIATDPPFNKGRDFHATPDSLAAGARFQDRWSWERDVHQEWTDQITDDHPRLMEAIESARYAHSDGMGAFMCFMAVRLIEMHRVLKPTGSIYLHCDPTASHYLKACMDAVFGWRRFQTEITWKRTYAHGDRVFSSVSDTILFYGEPCEIKDEIRVPLNPEYIERHFRHTDERGRYQPITLNGPKVSAGESGQPWKGVDPSLAGRCWSPPRHGRYAQWIEEEVIAGYRSVESVHARLDALYEAGLIHWPSEPSGTPRLKRYLRPGDGQLPSNVWTDINPVAHQANERRGYPTQKPLALYERMIRASTNEGEIVCDPFAGCATTLVAAEKLQRQWVGMDIWKDAHRLVVERLRDTTGLFGEVHYQTEAPVRTDAGETGAPFLRVKVRVKEPDGPRWTRAEMYEHLLDQHGARCQGCDREFDDPRYLELDHNTPRSDGGLNHISNRVLLCGPCNRLKSNTFTLSGLRAENKKRGYMR